MSLRHSDHEVLELLRTVQLAQGAHADLAVEVLEPARGQFDAVFAEGPDQVAGGDLVRRHERGVEADADGLALFAAEVDAAHARDGLEAVLELAFGDLGQFERRVAVAVERDPHHLLGVGVLLGDDAVPRCLSGQELARAGDAVAHVLRGDVHVAIEVEPHGDEADRLARDGGQGLDAGDGVDLLLDALGDLGLHHLGAGPAIDGGDGHDGRVHVGQLAHRQAQVADHAEQHDQQVQHDREDRPADAKLGERHGVSWCWRMVHWPPDSPAADTGIPSTSFWVPRMTIDWPTVRPERISTVPRSRTPSTTGVSRAWLSFTA